MSDDPTTPIFATDVSEPDDEAVAPRRKVYGVPRRFGMGTIFVVMTAFALLFGILKSWGVPGEVVLFLAGFLVIIGFAQMLLFGGKRPRLASIVASTALTGLLSLAWFAPLISRQNLFGNSYLASDLVLFSASAVGIIFFAGTFGVILGYTGGGAVAGVFLIMDYVQRWLYGQREAVDSRRSETSDL